MNQAVFHRFDGDTPPRPRFPLGEVVLTGNALRTIPAAEMQAGLARHAAGDWGELCDEDRLENERAAVAGGRLLSVYRSQAGVRFWIITEGDRSVTTLLLPQDY